MKTSLIKIVFGIVAVLSLANCKVTAEVDDVRKETTECEEDGSCLPTGKLQSQKITYFHGGWMAPSNSQNFRLRLELRVDSRNRVTVFAEDIYCSTTAVGKLSDMVELEQLVLKARREVSPYQAIDNGTNQITLSIKDYEDLRFLEPGDNSHGSKTIVKEDAEKILIKVDEIADKVFNKGLCDSPKPVID